jgi:hypothetical protein
MTNNIYFDNRDKSGAKYFRRARRLEEVGAFFVSIVFIVVCALATYGLAVLVGWV